MAHPKKPLLASFVAALGLGVAASGCATMGMRANVKVPTAGAEAKELAGTILMADPIGKLGAKGDASKLAQAAVLAQYGTHILPMDAVHTAAGAAHVASLKQFSDLLLSRYQAAFAALSQKERAARASKMAAAPVPQPKQPFPGYLDVPGLRSSGDRVVAGTTGGLDDLAELASGLAAYGAQLADAQKLVAVQDWQGFAAWREKEPEVAQTLDKVTQQFFQHAGVAGVLLIEVVGTEADYLAGNPVTLSYSLVDTDKASIRYFASMEVRKPAVPIPFSMQLSRAAFKLVETAKHASEAPERKEVEALVAK